MKNRFLILTGMLVVAALLAGCSGLVNKLEGITDYSWSVVVKDNSTANPIAGATMEVKNAGGETVGTVYTDASGMASLPSGLSDGVYTVVIKNTGYGQKTKTVTISNGSISDEGVTSVSLGKINTYDSETVTSFSSLADDTGGITTYSVGPEDLTDCIETVLNQFVGGSDAEIVLAIDATGSMSNDITQLRKDLIPAVRRMAKKFSLFHVGLVIYRDYDEDFGYKGLPIQFFDFTNDLSQFETNLDSFIVMGGGDKPEAVYEALYASIAFYDWSSTQRRIVLIGDAPPHSTPRGTGKYSRAFIIEEAEAKNLPIDVIILPS